MQPPDWAFYKYRMILFVVYELILLNYFSILVKPQKIAIGKAMYKKK